MSDLITYSLLEMGIAMAGVLCLQAFLRWIAARSPHQLWVLFAGLSGVIAVAMILGIRANAPWQIHHWAFASELAGAFALHWGLTLRFAQQNHLFPY